MNATCNMCGYSNLKMSEVSDRPLITIVYCPACKYESRENHNTGVLLKGFGKRPVHIPWRYIVKRLDYIEQRGER